MKKAISTFLAALAFAAAAPAMADPFAHSVITVNYGYGHPFAGLREINMRQADQHARIERGFHNGSITRREFSSLMAEQNHIQAIERSYVADGFLSPVERNDLHRRLDFAAQHIRWEATDSQRRF
jgi:hypothetical protein